MMISQCSKCGAMKSIADIELSMIGMPRTCTCEDSKDDDLKKEIQELFKEIKELAEEIKQVREEVKSLIPETQKTDSRTGERCPKCSAYLFNQIDYNGCKACLSYSRIHQNFLEYLRG